MKKRFAAAALALIVFAGGCVDISDRTLGTTVPPVTASPLTEPPRTVSIETTVSSPPTESMSFTTTTEPEIIEEYNTFTLTDEDKEFLSECVFVGDSICSGLMHYEFLPYEQIAAQGNIAARNILDFTFTEDGAERSLLSLLVEKKPKYVVFWMGMNDVNITTKQEFADNYENLLQMAESFLPDAKLVVFSITPVDRKSDFTSNSNIDSFNAAVNEMISLNEKWTFVDVSEEMKNSAGGLKTNYNGGDGIHLSPDAYYAVLGQFCAAMPGDEATVE